MTRNASPRCHNTISITPLPKPFRGFTLSALLPSAATASAQAFELRHWREVLEVFARGLDPRNSSWCLCHRFLCEYIGKFANICQDVPVPRGLTKPAQGVAQGRRGDAVR